MTDEGNSKYHYGYGDIKARAQHGGLTWDQVKVGTRLVQLRLRDKRHAALDAILVEHGLLEAANQLEQAQRALCAGMGQTIADVNKIRGTATDAAEWIGNLISDYLAWDYKCKEKYLSPMMCRKVIIEGYSLNEVDDWAKMRHGETKKQMIACLQIFSDMRK